jgi:mannose-6-phosphate isomerase
VTTRPYPLICEPILFPKVWGGDRLSRFGKLVNPGDHIGESWELADLASTSASGAGGGEARSRIRNGPLAGRTLNDALQEWGSGLLPGSDQNFPLLVKFLDARENLSVQVHPSPAYASAHPGANLKTEAWFILDAAPDAVIYKGVRPGVTPQQFAAHIADGSVVDDLIAVPAVPGECHNLPSGTVHALGAGVLVAEVQTPSDTTFRVFDWGRAGRELHIAQAMECIEFGPAPGAVTLRPGQAPLATEYFVLSRGAAANGDEFPLGHAEVCTIAIMLSGHGEIYSDDGEFAPTPVSMGNTVLIPARIAPGACLLAPEVGRVEALIAAVPVK